MVLRLFHLFLQKNQEFGNSRLQIYIFRLFIGKDH